MKDKRRFRLLSQNLYMVGLRKVRDVRMPRYVTAAAREVRRNLIVAGVWEMLNNVCGYIAQTISTTPRNIISCPLYRLASESFFGIKRNTHEHLTVLHEYIRAVSRPITLSVVLRPRVAITMHFRLCSRFVTPVNKPLPRPQSFCTVGCFILKSQKG